MGEPADFVLAPDVHPVIEIPSGNDLGPLLQELQIGQNPPAEKKGDHNGSADGKKDGDHDQGNRSLL